MKSGEQIWDEMSPARRANLDPALSAAARLHDAWPSRSAEIQRFANHLNSFWTGNAADTASSGGSRLAADYLTAGDRMAALQDAIHRQCEAAGTVAQAVVPVPPKPDPWAMFAPGPSPGVPGKAQQAHQAYNDAVSTNVQAYREYVASSTGNVAAMPEFGAGSGVAAMVAGPADGLGVGAGVAGNPGSGGDAAAPVLAPQPGQAPLAPSAVTTPGGSVPASAPGAPAGQGGGEGGMPMGGPMAGGFGGFGGEDAVRSGARYGSVVDRWGAEDDAVDGYLVSDEDGDAIVGELPRTAPPVIGE